MRTDEPADSAHLPRERAKVQPMSTAITGEGTFDSAGFQIFFRSWRPSLAPRAAVVIVPGFNSHSAYYAWTAHELVADRLAVYALDLRGRGKSDGERFYVETFDDYVRDVSNCVALVKAREPGVPLYPLGHSAGGVVACLFALDHQAKLAGLVCESFAYQLPAPDFALAVFKGLSHLAPHAHILHLKNEDFSRDPQAVVAMNADPLIAHETQPTRTLAALVRADERLKQGFPLVTKDKTLKLYEGHVHDLLNDLGKEAVMADIKAWIDARLPHA
jgi:alpha-beta hydrolase superfamily lysophospholipase